jgi:hypothetical protein
MPIQQIEQADMEEALLALVHFRDVQTAVPGDDNVQERLDAGEDPREILRSLLGELDIGAIAKGLRRLRESVGLTEGAKDTFWLGLTDLGIDHEVTEVEMAAFFGLFLGVRASQAAADRTA